MSMDNFLGGIHAVMLGLRDTLSQVTNYPLFWGFAMGFLTSTIAHALLLSDHPRDIPRVLFQEKAASFEKLYAPKEGETYAKSYSEYSKTVHRTKLLFLTAASIVLVLIVVVLIAR